jgi:hypothetical protein
MLGIMPTPYPDEIFYSVLARYHVYSGNKKTFNSINDLFGKQVMINVWWQGNLYSLKDRFPVLCQLEEEAIIYHHTLLPLFSLFMEKERAAEMIHATTNSNGERVLLRSLVGVQGLEDKCLFYCPRCASLDIDQYGEAYWHRIHQVPGVSACPHHRELLIKYEVKTYNQQQVRLRDINMIENICVSMEPVHVDENMMSNLVDIAKDFQYLLNTNLNHMDIHSLIKLYQHFLSEKKLAAPTGKIYREQLVREFEDFYGIEILEYIGFNYKNLLMRFLHKSGRAFPPIFHVLLMRFLAGSIEQFITTNIFNEPNTPFGDGPWYCLNPASDHYMERCVTDIKVGYSGFTKKPLGVFCCEQCGFAYSQLGVPVSEEDEQKLHRFVEFGPVWENRLRTLIQNKTELKQISEKLGVQPRKVKQVAEILGIQTEWKPSKTADSKRKLEEKRNMYRKEWLELRAKNKPLSKHELKELNSRVSTWLIRNDFVWYESNSPKKQQQYRMELKRDWEQRDEELLKIIKGIITNWNDEDKPVRITKNKIFDLVGKSFLYYNRLDKLEKSSSFIESVIESVEEFQIRRVKWAIKTLRGEGKLVTEGRVLQKIHLFGKEKISQKVMDAIKEGRKQSNRVRADM